MGNIVAIGGGDNGWGTSEYETGRADDEIIRLANKERPCFLFIGFVAKVPEEYYRIMCGIYAKHGCTFLHLDDEACKNGLAKQYIDAADIIYVGGGNTYKLMCRIRRYGLDHLLSEAYMKKENLVFSGVSAGAIIWCAFGNSATRFNKQGECEPVRVRGLDFLHILYCPHIARDFFREKAMRKMLRRTPGLIGLAIDYAALEVVRQSFRIVPLDERVVAKKKYWLKGKYYSRHIENTDYLPLQVLFAWDGEIENDDCWHQFA